MSQSFQFPPPPPPPPKRDSNPVGNTFPHPQFSRGRGRCGSGGGFSGNQSFRGGHSRGRGRGQSRVHTTNNQYHSRGQPHVRRQSHGENDAARQDSTRITPTTSSGHSTKRTHVTAFGVKQKSTARPQAPPAIPSFNADIESLIAKTTHVQSAVKPKAPKKSNLLGLTPSNNLSESESEADDDEARLAQLGGSDGLSFNHNGQTLSLRTPAEIAAWIAERKKNYPTNAKRETARKEAEEKKRAWESYQKQREEAFQLRKEERIKQRHDHEKQKMKQRLLAQVTAKAKAAIAAKNDDGSQRALTKTEKLQKDIERATKQLQVAEEALRRVQSKDHQEGAASVQGRPPEKQSVVNGEGLDDIDGQEQAPSITSDDSESVVLFDGEPEDTSSSGSSDSESDSGPQELSSKPANPESLTRPSQSLTEDATPVCRSYAKFGRCKYGRKCHYSHKIPKKQTTTKGKAVSASGRRKGLYEIMVEKEKEEEQKRALKAIIALGDRGLLKDDAPPLQHTTLVKPADTSHKDGQLTTST